MTEIAQTAEEKSIADGKKILSILTAGIILGIKLEKLGIGVQDAILLPDVEKEIKDIVSFIESKPDFSADVKAFSIAEGVALIEEGIADFKSIKA
jgi:hypothetical protein